MAHEQTVHILPGAKTAVLMIHGIAGTPDHFRTLLPLEDMIPETWSVYNVLMPGYGKRVEDFSRSSLQDWQKYVNTIFDELCSTHTQVILVGHSMGTLFAIEMALHRPDKVPFLFLIAVPLRVGVKAFGVRNLLRYGFRCLDLTDPIQEATSRVCSIPSTRMIWKYAGWLPRLAELIRKMHSTVSLLSQLSVPAIAYQSERDELVSNRSRRILEDSGRVEVYNLLRSTHFYYHPDDIRTVRSAFRGTCEKYL